MQLSQNDHFWGFFRATPHRELLETHSIYSEVTASIATAYPPQNQWVRAHFLTPKHGHEAELVSLRAKESQAYKDYATSNDDNELVKKREYNQLIDGLLIKKQPGSKAVYKWASNGQQIREDAYKKGAWRATVYNDLVDCINRTKVKEKVEDLNQLIAELNDLGEPAILTRLKTIEASGIWDSAKRLVGCSAPKTYSINDHSRWWLCFLTPCIPFFSKI